MEAAVEGFDPLAESNIPGGLDKSIAEEAVRREVLNVLKSYTGYFDLFSELLQNSLDAVDARRKYDGENYVPKIYVEIDISSNRVRVTDNGCGMNLDQFKFCFRPNVSFKNRRESRGHKGVGATFVAYGFSNVRLVTKKDGQFISGQLNNGRQWAEDVSGSFPRPRFVSIAPNVSELSAEPSGTSVEVLLENQQRPRLSWIQATNADQWLDLLRIKTPIGGIYLSAKSRDINVNYIIKVTDLSGNTTRTEQSNIDYYYPHEIPIIFKQKSISEIEKKIQSIQGDPSNRFQRLPDDFRRLDAVWDIWKSDQILKDPVLSRNLDEEQRILLTRHDVTLYGCFFSSAKTWTAFQKDILKVHPNAVLLRGGLQLASDFMPQGDLSVIPLTSTIGYQNNTHVVVHLKDGNPDMGRKVFQPEIKALADELGRRTVDTFKSYLALMREDTGAPTGTADRDLRDFILHQERHRENHPLALKFGDRECALLSDPQSEQDVVALFHELVGMGVLRGYGFLATSENERYDCVFITNLEDSNLLYSGDNKLGVSHNSERRESIPYIIEYKYDADALIDDFSKEKKYANNINLLVCWKSGAKTLREFGVNPLLVGDEGSVRQFYGSTHALYQLHEKRMEMICVSDLISYLRDPDAEEARQRQHYSSA